MKTIRIDDHVWEALQSKVKAFEDTPNSVLRRILKLDEANGKSSKPRLPRGERTPQQSYRNPILRALYESGGSARAAIVISRVGELLKGQLKTVDLATLSTGEVRWCNAVQFERNQMVKDGLLKKASAHGVWELAPKGISAAEQAVK